MISYHNLICPLSINSFKNAETTDIYKGPIRCSVLQWDPDNFNQIMVASDEDSSPTVKVIKSCI